MLGVLVESNVFPHRAPESHVLLRVIQGAVARPHLDELDDEALVRAAHVAAVVWAEVPAPTVA